MRIVSMIARKAYISEMDLLRLQKALLMCRMSADSTFLVDKQPPGYSSKLEYLGELLDGLFAEPDRKALLFSEWTTMLDLIEPLLAASGSWTTCGWTAPCRRRSGRQLVNRFREDPRLPAVHHHQRRLDGPEPPGGQHRDQRRPALEPGRAGAADRPGPPHGPAAAGAGVRAGDRRDDRGEPAWTRCRPSRTWPWRRWMPTRT